MNRIYTHRTSHILYDNVFYVEYGLLSAVCACAPGWEASPLSAHASLAIEYNNDIYFEILKKGHSSTL